MKTTRYSRAAAIVTLTTWINSVQTSGFYSKYTDRTVHLPSIDLGHLYAAKSLLFVITKTKKLPKKDFRNLVNQRWEVACTLPVNHRLFSEKTGYDQVRGKSKEICFDYGNYNFDCDIVFSMFSDII